MNNRGLLIGGLIGIAAFMGVMQLLRVQSVGMEPWWLQSGRSGNSTLLHIKAVSVESSNGTQDIETTHELWYDPANGNTRHERTSEVELSTSVRRGNVWESYDQQHGRLIVRESEESGAPYLNVPSEQLLGHGRRIATSRAAFGDDVPSSDGPMLRSVERDSAGTLRVEYTAPNMGRYAVIVDGEHWLPVSEVMGEEGDQDRKLVKWSYPIVERISSRDVDVDKLFRVGALAGVSTKLYRDMSLGDARDFTGFPVFFIGDTFNGRSVYDIFYEEDSGSPAVARRGESDRVFRMIYSASSPGVEAPSTMERVEIVEKPVSLREERTMAGRTIESSNTKVNGRVVKYYDVGNRVVGDMTIDQTWITVSGPSREDVEQAIQGLQPLN